MSDSISSAELADLMVKKTGMRKKTALQILRAIPEIVEEGLEREGEVRIKGLGTFRMIWISDRTGRNPRTGEKVLIPAHYKLAFLPEQSFRDYINRENRLLSYELVPSEEASIQKPEVDQQPEKIRSSLREEEPETGITDQEGPGPEPEPVISEVQQASVPASRKRRIHWVIPAAIVVIAVLSVVFYFRNFYPVGSRQSAVGSQQSAVINQQPTANGQRQTANAEQPTANGQRQTANGKRQTAITSTEGKHLFQLAREVYGNPFLWVLIYKANAEKIPDPDHLISGKELVIPALEGRPDRLTHNDSLNVAEGYRMVSEFYKAKDDPRAGDFAKACRRYQP